MRIVNTNTLEECRWAPPQGKDAGAGKEVAEAREFYDGEEYNFMTNSFWRKINSRGWALGAMALAAGLAGCVSSKPVDTVVASGHPDWPPVMFKEGNQIDGVGPALTKLVFADLGIACTVLYEGNWEQAQAKARSGEVDVLVAAYKTTEREKYYVYSLPYITDPLVIFVKAGHTFSFAKNEDLIGKTGIVMIGDSYGQEFDQYIASHLKVLQAKSGKEGFDWLESGQADYFIYSLYSGHEELKAEKRLAEFVTLPRDVAEEPFYIVISKQSQYAKYLPDINRQIQKYLADGTVAQMIAKYKKQFQLDQIVTQPAGMAGK